MFKVIHKSSYPENFIIQIRNDIILHCIKYNKGNQEDKSYNVYINKYRSEEIASKEANANYLFNSEYAIVISSKEILEKENLEAFIPYNNIGVGNFHFPNKETIIKVCNCLLPDKEKHTMDMKSLAHNALGTVKVEGTEAMWMTAATQTTLTVRAPLIAALRKNKVPESVLTTIGEFLDTEAGLATLSYLLGTGMSNIPSFGNNPKVAKLSSEMRIQGMTIVGNMLAEIVTGPMREVLSGVIAGIPEEVESVEEVSASTSSKSSGSLTG